MAELFDIAASALERHSGLSSLAARGTLRIALQAGGVEVRGLTRAKLRAVFENLMPRELDVRGVAQANAVCHAVLDAVDRERPQEASRTNDPDEILRRIGEG